MGLTKDQRHTIIKARISLANPKQLTYLENEMKRKLKSGWVPKELHDFIIKEIAKKRGETT